MSEYQPIFSQQSRKSASHNTGGFARHYKRSIQKIVSCGQTHFELASLNRKLAQQIKKAEPVHLSEKPLS